MRYPRSWSAARIAGSRPAAPDRPLPREAWAAFCAAALAALVHASVVGTLPRALIVAAAALVCLDLALHRPARLGRAATRGEVALPLSASLAWLFFPRAALSQRPAAPAPARSHDAGGVVTTVPTGERLAGPDGAVLHPSGDLLVASWAGGKGTRVMRVPRGGGAATVFLDGLVAPDAVLYGPDGALYVSNFGDGTVVRVDSAGGRRTVASGLGHPSGLAFDAAGDLYVADFGNFDGTVVHRVARDGTARVFARGFSAPIGLVFDPAGTLYVASFGSGEVHAVAPDGAARVHARVPNAPRAMLQYLARDGAGNLYVPSYGHQRVYRIDPAGGLHVVAGTGARGARDGAGAEATFEGPNSIVREADGTLWITEYDGGRVRRIVPAPRAR
ncbi:SMP-30/gluconolactonase/LRE family protein [Roseisolibacter sp. H3M3-2]|uniref:SMP-30/gluconolactonase/LRE family protein n=1 Tax=Roseisolibacter sp. H3M3-2 TaxID=3031323 RepID=UPI0023DC122E|nr:SMP-30/gluconolactonase/LRE family protein [Roseisolibacter sp. H3M3-2]MDF1503181.1 SMP-30/gluconolactonase/LRE family protein [Roseisolibacter sp. H3M3-2]